MEECQAVAALPAVDPDSWAPLFEIYDFNEAHGPLCVGLSSRKLPSGTGLGGMHASAKVVRRDHQFCEMPSAFPRSVSSGC